MSREGGVFPPTLESSSSEGLLGVVAISPLDRLPRMNLCCDAPRCPAAILLSTESNLSPSEGGWQKSVSLFGVDSLIGFGGLFFCRKGCEILAIQDAGMIVVESVRFGAAVF